MMHRQRSVLLPKLKFSATMTIHGSINVRKYLKKNYNKHVENEFRNIT